MDEVKRQRLEAAGWRIGNAADFLELSPQEAVFIEMKLSLSKKLKELRLSQDISQESLAKKINSSQSRVAKMEAGDASVSLDLLVRTLLAMGATSKDVAMALVPLNEFSSSQR